MTEDKHQQTAVPFNSAHYSGVNLGATLKSERPTKASRVYSFPVFGFILKVIMIIPFMFALMFIMLAVLVTQIINSWVILFTGKYWDVAYNTTTKMLKLNVEGLLFVYGITDSYPYFQSRKWSSPLVEYPEKSSRILGAPFIGITLRYILLIPFFLWIFVLGYARIVAVIVGNLPVFITGRYPKLIYEIVIDTLRLEVISNVYLFKLTDSYPSFRISWNHAWIKVLFLVFGFILAVLQFIQSSIE